MIRVPVALLVAFILSVAAASTACAALPSTVEEGGGSAAEKAAPDIPDPPSPPAAVQPPRAPLPPVPSRSPSAAPKGSPPSTQADTAAGVVEHASGAAQRQTQDGRATSGQGSSPASSPSRASRGLASAGEQGTASTGARRTASAGARGTASGREDSHNPVAGRLSTRPAASKGTESLRVNTSIPRWLARVWPAIALTWGWRPTALTASSKSTEMLVPFVGPGASLSLPALPALAASRELASEGEASNPSPAEAASGSQPKRFPLQQISDLDPGALKMFLLALGFVALSYVAVRYQGGGRERPHRHG
jgi:hypothetical protein